MSKQYKISKTKLKSLTYLIKKVELLFTYLILYLCLDTTQIQYVTLELSVLDNKKLTD